jgi:chorismate--pyruvate lyase
VSVRKHRDSNLAWAVHNRWLRSHVPAELRGWLLDAGSLTDRLRATCRGCFSVRVINEGWQRPRRDEARLLAMRPATLGWVRQVQLLCDRVPWVFARTVIPVATLSGSQRQLIHLGNRPLGAFLFADPGMRRAAVELACIRPGQFMFAEATAGLAGTPEAIWGRRSVFRVGGKPLLVTEVFLPTLESTP